MDSKGFELQARFHAPNDQTFINIKNTYHRKVIDAYNALLIDLMKLFFKRDLEQNLLSAPKIETDGTRLSLTGAPVKDESEEADRVWDDLFHEFCVATGRCGARCGAAKKAAQGDIIIAELQSRSSVYDLDLTPRVAQIAAEAILGRRSLSKEKLSVFATAGRTALEQSALIKDPEPLNRHIEEIKRMINAFNEHCDQAKVFYTNQWFEVWNRHADSYKKQ